MSTRVVIIGGGLAGLSAAVELVDRGVEVTLIEAGDRCGGKLAAWADKDGDRVEHGMHGWWRNYVNFLDLMQRVGIDRDAALQKAPENYAALPDGSGFLMKAVPVRLPSPAFLAAHFLQGPRKSLVDLLSVFRAGLAVLAFDTPRDYAALDGFTFRSWLWQRGVSDRMYRNFFEPYVRSFAFDSAARISAAAVLSSLHLYMVRHEEDLNAEWLTDDPDTVIIQPIVDYIRAHGGRVLTGVRAEGLLLDPEGRVTAVQTLVPVAENANHEPRGSDAVLRVAREVLPAVGLRSFTAEHGRMLVGHSPDGAVVAYAVPDAAGGRTGVDLHPRLLEAPPGARPLRVDLTPNAAVVRQPTPGAASAELARVPLAHHAAAPGYAPVEAPRPLVVGRDAAGVPRAFSPVCTHMGCPVEWRSESSAFLCPCHGAAFDAAGAATRGPTERPLHEYPSRIEGDDLVVLGDSSSPPVLEADYVVVATDVEGCKRLLSDRLREYDSFRRIDYLATTPVIVARLWFRGHRLLGDLTAGVFIDYPFLDNFFVLSNLQRGCMRGEETVVEVQAYRVDNELELNDPTILERVLEDLRRAFPALSDVPRKQVVLRHGYVFSLHNAGSDSYRPDTRTLLPNLFLAGDWVTRASVTWNMERAISTGRLAASAVIEDVGGVGPVVLQPGLGGRMFRATAAVIRGISAGAGWIGRMVRGDRAPEPGEPSWTPVWRSGVRFEVTKFPGEPKEQIVTGRFRTVDGYVRLTRSATGLVATGEFRIDLESLYTGIPLRDHNLRTALLNVPGGRYAHVVLRSARPMAGAFTSIVLGRDVEVECEGELQFRGVAVRVAFRALVTFLATGLLSARTLDQIVLSARALGLDVEPLRARCGAAVSDEIRVGVRLAVPVRWETASPATAPIPARQRGRMAPAGVARSNELGMLRACPASPPS